MTYQLAYQKLAGKKNIDLIPNMNNLAITSVMLELSEYITGKENADEIFK